jgi:hypothetical protein
MTEQLLINQQTALAAIGAQIAILRDKAQQICDGFFDKRKRINQSKGVAKNYLQPRLRVSEEGDSFTVYWVRYVPPVKGKSQASLKSTHINKGKTHKHRYADGNLKRAASNEQEYLIVREAEDQFEPIRKSLHYLVEARKNLIIHQKNLNSFGDF